MADDLPNDTNTSQSTAATTPCKVQVDVVVGNDYYDEIIRSEKIEIESGVFLVSSSLGWMFSGRSREKHDVQTNPRRSGSSPTVTRNEDVDSAVGVVEVVVNSEDVQKFVKAINLSEEDSQNQQLQQRKHHQHQPVNQPEQLNNERSHQEDEKLSELVSEKNKLNDILLKKEKIMDDLKTCEKEKERLNDVLHSTRVDMHKVIEALHGHDKEEGENDTTEEDEVICFDLLSNIKQ